MERESVNLDCVNVVCQTVAPVQVLGPQTGRRSAYVDGHPAQAQEQRFFKNAVARMRRLQHGLLVSLARLAAGLPPEPVPNDIAVSQADRPVTRFDRFVVGVGRPQEKKPDRIRRIATRLASKRHLMIFGYPRLTLAAIVCRLPSWCVLLSFVVLCDRIRLEVVPKSLGLAQQQEQHRIAELVKWHRPGHAALGGRAHDCLVAPFQALV